MAVSSFMVPLGTPASPFTLPTLDGDKVGLSDFDGAPGLLVAFLCNHCPYVRHQEAVVGPVLAGYAERGLGVVGVCSNDTDAYPDDRPDQLRAQAARAGWTFPYLLDTEQDAAAAYRAACTPDYFLYDASLRLAYRGAFDYSTPGNGRPVTGELLSAAVDNVLAGTAVPEPHQPSLGCSLKWKPGREPR
ncbi:MAG: thioredoxin family protein [Sporichthyaceae bacterium]|nr:thioredoxin family protein [Sporichthyaceae bacterium]